MEAEPVIPNPVIFDRAPILKRSIRGLPDDMLLAMIEGIETDPDSLVAGRLFKDREHGGCPVGMMLRVLYPTRYRRRWFRRSRADPHTTGIACERPRLAKQMPRLRHLEHVFDTTVRWTLRCRSELGHQAAARAVGLWFSAEAQAELQRRRADRPRSYACPDDNSRADPGGYPRGDEGAREASRGHPSRACERAPAGSETG
jgi:hypothetical protein